MSQDLLKDGLYPAIDRDSYDAIERENFSKLKHIAKTAAHYQHHLIHPPPDTDAKKLGRVSHIFAFEPERARNCIAVWPKDNGPRKGKDWSAFKERNQGKELLTENEYEECLAIQKAVRADATAQKYVQNGHGEVTALWTFEVGELKLPCKGRIDFDAATALVDLKTTRDGEPEKFGRQCHDLRYVAQAAWYVDGYFKATGRLKPYKVVAVESAEPYVVQVYNVPDELLELGREAYRGWLDRLIYCREKNYWPGYGEGELDLSLPRWAMPFEEDDGIGEFQVREG